MTTGSGQQAVNASRQSVDEWYDNQFRQLQARPSAGVAVSRRIAVVSTPRCGSTLFCNALGSTNLFGLPEEWFNPRRIEAYARFAGLESVDLGRYLNHVIDRTTTPNGVFSVNVHVDQVEHWKRKGLDILKLRFDCVIYLARRDKISQAYSYAKALETDQWRSEFKPRREFVPAHLGNLRLMRSLQQVVDWDTTFTGQHAHGVTARFDYEDYAADPGVYREALRRCGIDCPDDCRFENSLSVQRDGADLARIAAFRAYLTGEGA